MMISGFIDIRIDCHCGFKTVIAGRANFSKNAIHFVPYEGPPKTFAVRGARAAVAGIFLRFPAWLRIVGLRNYHRVITARGSDEFKYHYSEPEPGWLEDYVDPFFSFLYAHRKGFRIVAPVYRESPYFGRGKHRIFVTHSGYIVN